MNSYAQENPEFMNYIVRFDVIEQDIKLFTFFDFSDLLTENTNNIVPFYPELSYFTTMFNQSAFDETTSRLLEKPFMDHFLVVKLGHLPFDSLFDINIFSKAFLSAARNFFQNDFDSFLKKLCRFLLISKDNTAFG